MSGGLEVVSKAALLEALPKQVKGKLTDDILHTLNSTITDPNFREIYRDNLLGFTNIITEGKYKLSSYINAVRYVSYTSTGANGTQAYAKTFPDKYTSLVAEGASAKTISSYATTFKKTQLVQKIFEQCMIPVHIFNADIFQSAINTQATLMLSANSEKVRSDAANSLLTHLKPPEIKRIELDVGVQQSQVLDDLSAAVTVLAQAQQAQIIEGVSSPLTIAKSKIIADEVTQYVD